MVNFTQVAEMTMTLKRCFLFSLLVVAAFACHISQAAVTGEYLLNGNANDTSGLGRNGTVEGGGTFGATLYKNGGNALVQNAAGQSINLPANTDFIRNAPGATLMAWARPDNNINTTQTILVVNNADATQNSGLGAARAIIQLSGSQFRAIGRLGNEGSTSISGGTPVVSQTYFVAGVFDYVNSAMRLYVNGQQVAANTTIANWAMNSEDTANLVARIGSNANGTTETFLGAIDGARIFNTAMSAAEILAVYNAETFPLGDTDGNGVVDANDLTPIRNNWRLTGQTKVQGNLSGDAAGLVDFSDFRIWKTAFIGTGASLEGLDLSFATVPEPASLCLTMFGICVAIGSVRRRQSLSK